MDGFYVGVTNPTSLTSWPPCSRTWARMISSCRRRTCRAESSPVRAPRSVEPWDVREEKCGRALAQLAHRPTNDAANGPGLPVVGPPAH